MNENVVITGAANGIGRSLATIFAKNQYDLILVDIDKSSLFEVKEDLIINFGISVEVIHEDLSKIDSALKLINKIEALGLKIHILINNAGFGHYGDYHISDFNKNEKMMILNMITPAKLSYFFINKMENDGGGLIVNISSMAAFHGTPKLSLYSATKSFLLSLTESLSYELRNKKVKTIAICPGPTKSNFAKTAEYNVKSSSKATNSEEVANYIFNSINKNNIVYIPGLKNKLAIFSQRLLPRTLVTYFIGKLVDN